MEYEVTETEEFKNWRENLQDLQARHRIQARIDRVISGNFGDWKTEAGEVRAMRIDYGRTKGSRDNGFTMLSEARRLYSCFAEAIRATKQRT